MVATQERTLVCAPLLAAAAAQADTADRTRSVDDGLVASIKASPLVRMSAVGDIGGEEASVLAIARELEALAPACGSTAWVVWNHLCVFHLVIGQLGPACEPLLRSIVENGEMVSFPGGAGTSIVGPPDGDDFRLTGRAAFGTGARYGDWMATVFAVPHDDPDVRDVRFTITATGADGVRIDPTWDGSALRASATDDIYFTDVHIPADRVAPFVPRFALREPARPMVAPRYREDWVALADLWLAAMAVGVAEAALNHAVENVTGRIGAAGAKMLELPIAHANLGEAHACLLAARASYEAGCRETDARIEAGGVPDEPAYLRQMAFSLSAVQSCQRAMELIQRTLGGNGLRESRRFDRLYRDFQAMPLHITVHRDRVAEMLGRNLLGLPATNTF